MAEFIAGPTLTLSWVCSAGTVSLNGDYRTCNWTPTIAYVDSSAGADTNVGRLTALKDATAAVTLVTQSGTAGTTVQASLSAGNAGTLIIKPQGTATGGRIITIPCYADGGVCDWPYSDIAVISCGFTGNGAYTDTFN
jgi:hypothetical protein